MGINFIVNQMFWIAFVINILCFILGVILGYSYAEKVPKSVKKHFR